MTLTKLLIATIQLLILHLTAQRGSFNDQVRPEDIYVLTIGGERSKDIYAFEADSFQELRVPDVHLQRKAGASVYFDNSIVTCGGISEQVDNRQDLHDCSVFKEGLIEQEPDTVDIPSLPVPLQYFKMIVYYNNLLVIGGTWKTAEGERMRSNEILRYVPSSENRYNNSTTTNKKGVWEKYLFLEIPRSSHECLIIFPDSTMFADITKDPTQDLYCFGGLTENGRTDSMEIYEKKAQRWFKGPNMSIPRSAFAATSYKSKIYVSGGKNDKAGVENTLDMYDIRERKWKLYPETMTVRRYYHTMFYNDGLLFLRGGTNKQESELARKTIEMIEVNKLSGDLRNAQDRPSKFMQYHQKYDGKSLHDSIIIPRSWLPNLDPDILDWEPEATPRFSGIDEETEFDSEKFGISLPTPSSDASDLVVNAELNSNSLLSAFQAVNRRRTPFNATSSSTAMTEPPKNNNNQKAQEELKDYDYLSKKLDSEEFSFFDSISTSEDDDGNDSRNTNDYEVYATDETGNIIVDEQETEYAPTDESGLLVDEVEEITNPSEDEDELDLKQTENEENLDTPHEDSVRDPAMFDNLESANRTINDSNNNSNIISSPYLTILLCAIITQLLFFT